MNRIKLLKYSGLLFCLVLFACVSPKKKKEDVGFIGRKYQDLTAYYNGYYNANVLIEEARVRLVSMNPDDYQEILPVYPEMKSEDTTLVAGDMNKAIDKLKRVVFLHPASEWVGDAYCLMGQAQYYKRDFERAENTFTYVTQNYSPEKLAQEKRNSRQGKKMIKKERAQQAEARKDAAEEKADQREQKAKDRKEAAKQKEKERKKKQKERKKSARKKSSSKKKTTTKDIQVKTEPVKTPTDSLTAIHVVKETKTSQEEEVIAKKPAKETKPKNYFLKHKPIYQKAQLWLGKTYIERGKYDDARNILDELKMNPGTFADIRREAYLAYGYLHLKNKQSLEAIPQLEKALSLTSKRPDKARINYILGQLYSETGMHEKALASFAKAEKLKPAYEMVFNAQINQYKEQLALGTITPDDLHSDMKRMLRDIKNDDYRDQIYFMMGDIALQKNNIPEAIGYLQQGINASKKGTAHKSEQYLKIANLFYDREDYINAYAYYDSASVGYPKTKPFSAFIVKRRDNLKDIAANLKTIALNDSLLRLSQLSPEEQEAFAKKLIKQRKKDKQQNAPNTTAIFDPKMQGPGANKIGLRGQNSLPTIGGSKPSSFFAYNEKALKDGKKQFDQKWGSRPLVDNWRYKSQISGAGSIADGTDEDPINQLFISKSEIEDVLKEIPNDESSKKVANDEIAKALMQLGKLYPENIDRYDKGIASLEDLLRRYPNSGFEPEAYYRLYFAYIAIGNQPKADYYAGLLKDKFKGNPYAVYFTNPEMIQKKKDEANQLNIYYAQTYDSLMARNYAAAYRMSSQSDSLFSRKNELRPKFMLITAMSTGNLKGKKAYVDALNDLVKQYPNTDEERRAKEMLRLLGSGSDEDQKRLGEAEKIYKEDAADQHFVLVVLKPGIDKIEVIKAAITDYNEKYFKSDKLRLANITLMGAKDRQTIIIRSFDSKAKAMDYYNQTMSRASEFLAPAYPYDLFCIANNNYKELLRTKDVDLYLLWFTKYYRNMGIGDRDH